MLFFGFVALFLLSFTFGVVQFGHSTSVLSRLGIGPVQLLFLLLASMAGSLVNMPLFRKAANVRPREFPSEPSPTPCSVLAEAPPIRSTLICVNLGGAIIPIAFAFYLMWISASPIRMFLALAVVTSVAYRSSKTLTDVGIAIPMLVPPLTAALVSLILNYEWAAPTAYFSGTIGTLIGADLLNLFKSRRLDAPVISIGGAGTFDGIFLTGIIAAVLALLG